MNETRVSRTPMNVQHDIDACALLSINNHSAPSFAYQQPRLSHPDLQVHGYRSKSFAYIVCLKSFIFIWWIFIMCIYIYVCVRVCLSCILSSHSIWAPWNPPPGLHRGGSSISILWARAVPCAGQGSNSNAAFGAAWSWAANCWKCSYESKWYEAFCSCWFHFRCSVMFSWGLASFPCKIRIGHLTSGRGGKKHCPAMPSTSARCLDILNPPWPSLCNRAQVGQSAMCHRPGSQTLPGRWPLLMTLTKRKKTLTKSLLQ